MKTKKTRVVLSAISILLVLGILAGGTMAWFTDTEAVQAGFTAGVLDIHVKPGEKQATSLEFKNLRPMQYNRFYNELQDNGTEDWVNNVENGSLGLTEDDYMPIPSYFKPVVIQNDGTLPVDLHLSMALQETPDCPGEEDISLSNDHKTVNWNKDNKVPCSNRLEDVLKIYVYRLNGDRWERVEQVNLNPNTAEDEVSLYHPETRLGAGMEVTYVIAGYLPEDVDNRYQGKHFHGSLLVNALQTDQNTEFHTIHTNHSGSGSITVNKTQAKAGQKIEVTAKPQAGSKLESILVTDESGQVIYKSMTSPFCFEMPDFDVEIQISFTKDTTEAIAHQIHLERTGSGSVIVSKAKAKAGQEVEVEANPSSGYELEKILVMDENGQAVYESTASPITFVMPDCDVKIQISFVSNKAESETYRIKVAPLENGSLTIDKAKAKAGQTIKVTAKPKTGYELDNILIVNTEDQNQIIAQGATSPFTFQMPENNVTVKATFKKVE